MTLVSQSAKQEGDRTGYKTRVNIGVVFVRWQDQCNFRGLKSDTEVANKILYCDVILLYMEEYIHTGLGSVSRWETANQVSHLR